MAYSTSNLDGTYRPHPVRLVPTEIRAMPPAPSKSRPKTRKANVRPTYAGRCAGTGISSFAGGCRQRRKGEAVPMPEMAGIEDFCG